MVGNDQPIGEDAVRLRRAIQQNILENPGMRQPIRAGEGSGLDPDTGWNFRDDGNPNRFTSDKKEIRRMAIEINQAYQSGGANAVREKLESYAVREDYKKQREKAYSRPAGGVIPPNKEEEEEENPGISLGNLPPSLDPQPFTPQPLIQSTGTYDVMPVAENPPEPAELPEDFRGIKLVATEKDQTSSVWKQLQIQCIDRPDLDTTYPDDLTDDVKEICHGISFVNIGESGYIISIDGEKEGDTVYFETIPFGKFVIAVKGRIHPPMPEK